jgi:WD40 repeat protein
MRFDQLRMLLSITLVTLFFVSAFSVLFFSFGYRFNFDRGIFIHTGSITIKSNPKDARILLDGKDVPSGLINIINQSYHITGLRPGEHFLRIEANGYRPWGKKVTIQSGISTEFWNILLIRNTYPVTEIASGKFQKVFPSPEQRYLALVSNIDEGVMIDVLEKGTGEVTRIASLPGYRFDIESHENIEWMEDGSRFLLPIRDAENRSELFIIDRESGASTGVRELTGSEETFRVARWHPRSDGSFFALSGTSLWLVHPNELATDKRVTVIETGVSAYDLSEQFIYLLDQATGTIRTLGIRNEGGVEPKDLTRPIPEAASMKEPVLNAYDEKRAAIYEPRGDGFLWNDTSGIEPELSHLGGDIRSIQFSNDGKKILLSDGNQISVMFVRDWDTQPIRRVGESIQIARFSVPFSSVQWSKNYEHALFSIGADVRIAELDHRDRRQMDTLLSFPGRTVTQILPSFDENLTIFLVRDEATGDSRIYSIAFPESTNIFGN